MMHRSLTRPQNPPQEIDFHGLQQFQDETVREMRDLQTISTRQGENIVLLQDRLNRLETLLTWIGDHRPDAIIDYNTTMDVAKRLSDSNNNQEMIQEMQVTP